MSLISRVIHPKLRVKMFLYLLGGTAEYRHFWTSNDACNCQTGHYCSGTHFKYVQCRVSIVLFFVFS